MHLGEDSVQGLGFQGWGGDDLKFRIWGLKVAGVFTR